MLDMPLVRIADSFALMKTGNRIAARMAMIAITTRSSISVKARGVFRIGMDTSISCSIVSVRQLTELLGGWFFGFGVVTWR